MTFASPTSAYKRKIGEMWRAGFSSREIADATGLKSQIIRDAISRWRKAQGVSLWPRRVLEDHPTNSESLIWANETSTAAWYRENDKRFQSAMRRVIMKDLL